MFSIKLPEKMVRDLYVLREYCAEGPITHQVRLAISKYLLSKEKELGCEIQDAKEAIDRHVREKGVRP